MRNPSGTTDRTARARRETGGYRRRAWLHATTLAIVLAAGAPARRRRRTRRRRTSPRPRNRATGGWVVGPDFKFTRVNEQDGALVGAYGGNFIDRGLLVGGAAYVLRGTQGVSMAYGGGLVEWFEDRGGLIDFSVRGFLGLGTAALSSEGGFSAGCGHADGIFNDDLSGIVNDGGWGMPKQPCWTGPQSITAGAAAVDNPGHGQSDWDTGWPGWPLDLVPARQNFLLAEPQASIHLNVTPWLRIGGGAGYRLIGRGGPFTGQLQGLTTNIGMQIGPR